MMGTLLCLIYLHANTFAPIYTCLEIQFNFLSGSGCLRVPRISGYPDRHPAVPYYGCVNTFQIGLVQMLRILYTLCKLPFRGG